MRYLDGITTIPPAEADNPLILGTAVHTGIEKGLETAIKEYAFSYPILTDQHINEIMKLETVIPKTRAAIPNNGEFEVPIVGEDFIGFIDYLVPCGYMSRAHIDNPYGQEVELYDLYDFKYTKNPVNYRNSPQLSLYKYFFEKYNPGKKIRNLYFVFIPKVGIQQKKTETLREYRQRLGAELKKTEVQVVKREFNYSDVIDFLLNIKKATEKTQFTQNKSHLCKYCEFYEFCEKGNDYMIKLPENKRRTIEAVTKRVIWIYGAPFCGKTTFANGFPDPLMINTDGNIRFVDAPYIPIKDEVKVEGRITKRTLAWELFKETIAELEKKNNDFKTIVVDLLEDTHEYCRLYMYNQMGITHESDDSFRAWDKVRSEFLNTLKRLMNLDYENIILISHEDMSRDLTKRSGDRITAIKPNLQDKVATKVAGMVDVVARIVADGDSHMFCFKSNEVIFGGGRLGIKSKDIPLDVDALFEVYDEANKRAASTTPKTKRTTRKKAETPESPSNKPQEPPEEDKTVNTSPAGEAPQEAAEAPPWEGENTGTWTPGGGQDDSTPIEPVKEEKPRRRRKARD